MIRFTLLLLLLSTCCYSATWRVTVECTGPLPANYSVEVASYVGDSFEFWFGADESSELLRVFGTLESGSPRVNPISIVVDFTLNEPLTEGILTHTFEVELNETPVVNHSAIPAFVSNFSR